MDESKLKVTDDTMITSSGSGVDAKAVGDLTKSVQSLALASSSPEVITDKVPLGDDKTAPGMEMTRMKQTAEKKATLRALWKEETRLEILQRMQFQVKLNDCVLVPDDWQHVLKHVEEPQNKTALSKMSLVWRDLLKKDRASFLFRETFPLLFGKAPLEHFQTILNCRTVSTNWRDGVDTCLQDTDLAAQVELDRKTSGPESKPGDVSMDISLYGEGMEPFMGPNFCLLDYFYPGENPFISRGLRIENWPEGIMTIGQFQEDIMDIVLRPWGEQLWQLFVAFPDGPITVGVMYQHYLCPFLRMTPNLRRLSVGANEFWTCMREAWKTHPILKDHRVAQGGGGLEVDALPELPELRSLRTSLVPPEIHLALLYKYGATLESICMSCYGGVTMNHVIWENLPRLKQFCFITTKEKALELRMGLDWPVLEEFRSLHYNVIAGSIPAIFHNVNNFGKSLRKLMLVFEKGDGPISKLKPEEIKGLSLNLPLVEEFTLYIRGLNLSRVDFILPMASLKLLNLYYGKSEKKEAKSGPVAKSAPVPGPSKVAASTSGFDPLDEEMIQFTGYTNRLYESNIWSLFPELRIVAINIVTKPKGKSEPFMNFDKTKVKRKTYTREGYGQYCAEQNAVGAGLE